MENKILNNKTIIQALWIGKSLGLIERLSITSFLKNNHIFHLYVYETPEHVPDGTVIMDASQIIDKAHIFTYYGGSYAGFADWFRWKLLYLRGGYYVDLDVICLRPLSFSEKIIFGYESDQLVCPAVVKFPKSHNVCWLLESICYSPHNILPWDSWETKWTKLKRKFLREPRCNISWGEAGGPIGFTNALKHLNLLRLAKPQSYFYHIPFQHWKSIFETKYSNISSILDDSIYSIHLWNEMRRRNKYKIIKQDIVKGTIFYHMVNKYL